MLETQMILLTVCFLGEGIVRHLLEKNGTETQPSCGESERQKLNSGYKRQPKQ